MTYCLIPDAGISKTWIDSTTHLDPLAVHSGQRIWLDALLAGLVSLGTGLYLTACTTRSRAREILLLGATGLSLGLAVLTKLPGVLALPILALIFWRSGRAMTRNDALRHLFCVGLPIALLVTPWFVEFHRHYGTLFPDWIRPNAWMQEQHPFVKRMLERPGYYFFLQTLLIYPWLGLTAWTGLRTLKRKDDGYTVPALFVLWILVTLTGLALFAGHGFQLRYVTMIATPLYVLFALTLRDLLNDRRWALPLLLIGASSAVAIALVHVVQHTWFDLRSWIQMLA